VTPISERGKNIRLGGPFRPGGLFSPHGPMRFGGALRERDGANAVRIGASTLWLLFILFPLIDAVTSKSSPLPRGVVIASAILFIAGYLGIVFSWRWQGEGRLPLLLFGMLLVISTLLSVGEKGAWAYLFTYCAACAAVIVPDGWVGPALGLCIAMAVGTSALGGSSAGNALGAFASTAGVGLLMLLLRDLRTRNTELLEARAELAKLAVAEERERFARDLHDLLGHSLSVIALKAELAGRLLESGGAGDAAAEIADVESVARGALSEVRDAVSGYRNPTLDGELEGARVALSAAGIETSVERAAVALDPRAETVFAWAVREGATNVIRHSGARHVTVRIGAGLDAATLEMLDDGGGRGALALTNGGGHGLDGLAERVGELSGVVEASDRPEGGFRLMVTLPSAIS
jgi:two-component system, NarL family, sensor histidine kinase DesK